jgi:protein-tyrosine phosphatase
MPLIPDSVHIWRTPAGECHVQWQTSDPATDVEVQALTDGAQVATDPAAKRAQVTNLDLQRQHRYRLSDQHGNEVVASERRLGFAGTPNFRDFGGYTTVDGRRVRWGFLFRSGQLSGLSDDDLQLMDSLGLDFICDFRREEEQVRDPSRLPRRQPRAVPLPITPGSSESFFQQAGEDDGGSDTMYRFMVEINRDFVTAQSEAYRQMFAEILAVEEARFLVHCAAGKDRTGFAAAIVLAALGVPRETLMRDYLLTREFFSPDAEVKRLQRKYDLEHMQAQAVLPMLEVHEDYLAAALASIEAEYGDMATYLERALGVGASERAALQARYLESI